MNKILKKSIIYIFALIITPFLSRPNASTHAWIYEIFKNCDLGHCADKLVIEENPSMPGIASVTGLNNDGQEYIKLKFNSTIPSELLTAAIYHECGHIANGDLNYTPEKCVALAKFIFYPICIIAPQFTENISQKYLSKTTISQELAADQYACDKLISLNKIDELVARMVYFINCKLNCAFHGDHPDWQTRYNLIIKALKDNNINFLSSFRKITQKYLYMFSSQLPDIEKTIGI